MKYRPTFKHVNFEIDSGTVHFSAQLFPEHVFDIR
jgi:hypothetical protein